MPRVRIPGLNENDNPIFPPMTLITMNPSPPISSSSRNRRDGRAVRVVAFEAAAGATADRFPPARRRGESTAGGDRPSTTAMRSAAPLWCGGRRPLTAPYDLEGFSITLKGLVLLSVAVRWVPLREINSSSLNPLHRAAGCTQKGQLYVAIGGRKQRLHPKIGHA